MLTISHFIFGEFLLSQFFDKIASCLKIFRLTIQRCKSEQENRDVLHRSKEYYVKHSFKYISADDCLLLFFCIAFQPVIPHYRYTGHKSDSSYCKVILGLYRCWHKFKHCTEYLFLSAILNTRPVCG